MKIFGAALSPFVRKLLVYCAERQITFDHVPTFPMGPDGQGPEFMAVSPFGKIPAIDDDGMTLADSSAIIHYLEARDGSALLPEDAQARGRAVFFDEIADTVLTGVMGTIFVNRIVRPKFMGLEGDMAAAETAEQETLPPILSTLEGLIAENSEFLVGDRMTVADIALASPFVNMMLANVEVDGQKYPKLAHWLGGIWGRPAYAEQIAVNKKMVEG